MVLGYEVIKSRAYIGLTFGLTQASSLGYELKVGLSALALNAWHRASPGAMG